MTHPPSLHPLRDLNSSPSAEMPAKLPFIHHYKTSNHLRKCHKKQEEQKEQPKNDKIRLVIQFLKDSGYEEISKSLEEESNCQLEDEKSRKFKEAIHRGDWTEAIDSIPLLDSIKSSSIPAIILKIKKHTYYELLVEGKLGMALAHLKSESFLSSLKAANEEHSPHIKEMASLVPLGKDEVKRLFCWNQRNPRDLLFNELLPLLPPSLFIPKGRFDQIINNSLLQEKSQCHLENPLNHLLNVVNENDTNNDDDGDGDGGGGRESFLYKHCCVRKELDISKVSSIKLDADFYTMLNCEDDAVLIATTKGCHVSVTKWTGKEFISIQSFSIDDDYSNLNVKLLRYHEEEIFLILLCDGVDLEVYEFIRGHFVNIAKCGDISEDEKPIDLGTFIIFKNSLYISSSNPPLLAEFIFPSLTLKNKREDLRIDDIMIIGDCFLMMDNGSNMLKCSGDIHSLDIVASNIPLSTNRFGNQKDSSQGVIIGGLDGYYCILKECKSDDDSGSSNSYSICSYVGDHVSSKKSIQKPAILPNGLIAYPGFQGIGVVTFYDKEDGSRLGECVIDNNNNDAKNNDNNSNNISNNDNSSNNDNNSDVSKNTEEMLLSIHPLDNTSFISISVKGNIGVYEFNNNK